MKKEEKKPKFEWIQILVSAVITGFISLIVALIIFYQTKDNVELVFEKSPISIFKSQKMNLGIVNIKIHNLGSSTARNLYFYADFPENTKIIEPICTPSQKLIKVHRLDTLDNYITYRFESLHAGESSNFSFLIENIKPNDNVEINLRSDNSNGSEIENNKKEYSTTLNIIKIIIGTVSILVFIILLYIIRKSMRSWRSFKKFIRKDKDEDVQKMKDIVSAGVDYCDIGLIEESIKVLTKGIYQYPDSSSVHCNLARAYAKKGNFDRAKHEHQIAEKLLKDDMDKIIFYYTKAQVASLNNIEADVISNLKEAIKLESEIVIEKSKLDVDFDVFREKESFKDLIEANSIVENSHSG